MKPDPDLSGLLLKMKNMFTHCARSAFFIPHENRHWTTVALKSASLSSLAV